MKVTGKGQVTIPARLRAKYRLSKGDEVEVVDDNGTLRIVLGRAASRGQRLARHMRGRGTATDAHDMTTDDLMELLRGE